MMLKKIMHFFCDRSLEKETAKTNSLIRQVEQHEKAAMERLKAQAINYQTKVATYKKARDVEFKEFIAFMNKQLGLADAYVRHLGDFQDKMFVCFDSWMKTSIAEQEIQLLSARITTKLHLREFITALQMEMNKLSQRKERNEWHHMIKARPVLVSSEFIQRTVWQVNNNQKSNSKSISCNLSRLKSHLTALRREIEELRHKRDQLITSSRDLIGKHQAHKAKLNDQYRNCNKLFREIQDGFSNHFGSVATGNSLADSWIAKIEGAVTLSKLFSTHKGTADIQKEVQHELDDINNDFRDIRCRIKANRQIGDFSTLSGDKVTRDRLYHEREQACKRQLEISAARDVIYKRGNELKEMLGKFDSLEPDKSIRRFVEIFGLGKDFDVHRVIGISTRESRRRHYELKNQNR